MPPPTPKPKKKLPADAKLKPALNAAPAETAVQKKARLEAAKKAAKGRILDQTKRLKVNLQQNMTLETFAKGIENIKQLREKIKSAPIRLIEQIEDKWPGLTIAAFTTHLKGQVKLDFKNWSSDAIYSKFKPNTPYTINFLGNQEAEQKWGWADMAHESWRGMTKYSNGDKKRKRKSDHRVGLKGQNKADRGYFDKGRGYLAIHSDDSVMYHDVKKKFTTEFRAKDGDNFKELNQASYDKYALSKYAKEDTLFMKKNANSYSFLKRTPGITRAEILRIRKAVGGLEGLQPAERVVKVAEYIIKKENHLRAQHCGHWVKLIYSIAGITRKQSLYPLSRSAFAYACVNNDYSQGWKPKKNPDGSWNMNRYDSKISGMHAKKNTYDKILPGDHLYVNNRNKYDNAGNHSVIFLRWKNKNAKIAEVLSWYANKPGSQRIKTYNFNDMPVVYVSRPTEAHDEVSQEHSDTKKKGQNNLENLNVNDQDLIKRGSTPFAIKIGYKKTREEERWYQSTRKEGRRLGKMNINNRIAELQERYQWEDALKYSAQMVGIDPKKNPAKYKLFLAMNDAVLRVESNYNPYNHNTSRGRIKSSTAAGEYQLLHSAWKEAKQHQNPKYRRQFAKVGLNHDMYSAINMTATRPEFATPYQRTVAHNMYVFRYTKLLKSLIGIPQIFDKIQRTSGRVRRSYIKIIYLVWRNGPGGAGAFHRNMRKFEQTGEERYLMPETKQQTEEYYQNNLTQRDWQKGKRSKSDYLAVMRTTKKFANRFEKNLSQL